MPKTSLAQQPQGSRESKRPTVPLGRLCPFPHGQPAQQLPDRLWLPRALCRCRGQEQTCACGSALAWECGPPAWPPGSGARAGREHHPEALLSRAWEHCARLAGTAGESACKAAFGGSRGGLPAGEGRLCSEAPQARVRTQQGPFPWPALPRPSWSPGVLPHQGAGCGDWVQTFPCAFPGSSPLVPFPWA